MSASNNIFPQLASKIFARYKKTVPYMLGGRRLDPFKVNENAEMDWILQTDDDNFDFITKQPSGFTYEDEVIELYSEVELQVFKKLNAALFSEGLLQVYQGTQTEVVDNTGIDLDELAKIKLPTQFKKAVAKLPKTMLPALEKKLREKNRPISFFDIVQTFK
jgi:hypothetical protein